MRALTTDPRERDPSLYWDAVHQSSFYLAKQSLDLPRQYRKLTGRMHEAVNVDVFGEVPNSSWFTNRHGKARLSREELKNGPNKIAGPELKGPWTITRAKTQGVTPGFFFKDANGESFVLKFDPAMNPELATGAEMVCTKLFHAMGYNVPENYLVTFDPSILEIKEGLKYKDARGRSRAFTQELLNEILTQVALRTDGKIRAVASRLLPGKPVGPFSYKGRRKDDPNDLIPHEHRRELRAIMPFAQLVNNFDTKDHNTLDVVVDENGRRYVRHYLIDFSSTLGSDSDEPKSPYKGYSYTIDVEQALASLFTLGFRRWSWEKGNNAEIPASVGYFESELFTPRGWKPLHANPAFDNMTPSDAQWACGILSRFSKDDILACIESAEYSDPAAADYLLKTIWERRTKILEYYSTKVSLLDDFLILDDGTTLSIRFRDVATEEGLQNAASSYSCSVSGLRQDIVDGLEFVGDNVTLSSETRRQLVTSAASASGDRDRIFRIELVPVGNGRELPGIRLYVYFNGNASRTRLVGIDRQD